MTCSRREACQGLISLAGLVLVPGCANDGGPDDQLSGPMPLPAADNGVVTLLFADYPGLAKTGGWVRGQPDGLIRPLIVVHHGTGMNAEDFSSIGAHCTHRGCSIDYYPDRVMIECPCHGAQFDFDGTVLRGPADMPEPSLLVTLIEGGLMIDATALV